MDIFDKFKDNIPHILFYGNVKEDNYKNTSNNIIHLSCLINIL